MTNRRMAAARIYRRQAIDIQRSLMDMRPLMLQGHRPQHGSIMKGDDLTRFLDWFEALNVGTAG